MNPALPVLLLLSLAPLAVRRRGWTPAWRRAWALSGIAAMVLLAPALALPDGVPSPAASLGTLPPWQGAGQDAEPADGPGARPSDVPTIDPTAGNPHLRDITFQVEPWLIFQRSELRDGRLPYWNPFQFSGTPFWSNGSSAPLFPLHLLFAALPLQLGLVLLPWLRLVIGGMGAWTFARQLGASERGALLAAVAFPLSGVVSSWLLYPMANCHALVPWVFWATERLARRPAAWPWLAALGGLELLGGHPETAVFTGMLTAVYLVVRWPARKLATGAAFAGGWLVALLLAAVELVPLAATVSRSSKWLVELPYTAPSLALVGRLLLRLVMPDAFGRAAPTPLAPFTAEALAAGRAGTWWGPFNDPATAIYAGTATLLLAAAGAAAAWSGWRRERREEGDGGEERERCWLAVAAMTLFALLAAYQAPGVRHVLLALPVIDKSLTHYLKMGLDLGLALLAARGVDAWLASSADAAAAGRRALLAATAAVLALVGLCWGLFRGDWAAAGLLPDETAWTVLVVAVALALAASLRLRAPARRRLWPILPALLIADLAFAHAWTNPGLSVAALYPQTGAVRFLRHRAGALERIAGAGSVLHPNAAMVYRLYDVRGDTPVKLHDYQKVYATFAAPDPVFYQPIRRWDSPWLDRLGVRWVMTAPGAEAPFSGGPGRSGGPAPWRLAYDGADARVWRRPGGAPAVRWLEEPGTGRQPERPAGRSLDVFDRSPGHWTVAWRTPEPATVVVAEAWDPGWRARVDGRPVPVEAVRGVLLGVDVGGAAPSGRLELSYRPEGLEPGAALSLLGLIGVAVGAWSASRSGRRSPARDTAPPAAG